MLNLKELYVDFSLTPGGLYAKSFFQQPEFISNTQAAHDQFFFKKQSNQPSNFPHSNRQAL